MNITRIPVSQYVSFGDVTTNHELYHGEIPITVLYTQTRVAENITYDFPTITILHDTVVYGNIEYHGIPGEVWLSKSSRVYGSFIGCRTVYSDLDLWVASDGCLYVRWWKN